MSRAVIMAWNVFSDRTDGDDTFVRTVGYDHGEKGGDYDGSDVLLR